MLLIQRLALIALAGAIGALCRFGLSVLTQRLTRSALPWGTLVVNAVACFAIGVLWALFEDRVEIGKDARAFIFVGFLGAFSTFSTYMLETTALIQGERWAWAVGNLLAHNVLGLALTLAGLGLVRNF